MTLATDDKVIINLLEESLGIIEQSADADRHADLITAILEVLHTERNPVASLAHAFIRHLREELTTDQWEEMCERNREETNPSICHSHDFCDANMVMAPAFEEVFGRPVDVDNDADTALWGKAWDLALELPDGLKGSKPGLIVSSPEE